jgi:uncharacterized damage-inducible protein DinB
LPGCFASHEQRDEALAAVPQAVKDYLDWCRWNGVAIAGVDPNEPLQIDEMILEWFFPNGEAVNAFFAADAAPISSAERVMAAALLDWTRADLLKAINGLSPDVMNQAVEGEWDISGIFYHTLRSDWHYLHVLGLAPDWAEAPSDSNLAAVLEWTQSLYLAALSGMVEQNRIVQVEGEVWSPRKTLRRALWHRRDHTAHIYQFREKLGING